MATIVLGCDKNGYHDKECQDTVAKLLENAGHKVEKLAIHPNTFANASYKKSSKGKIGVFLHAAGTYSIADLYYGKTYFKYAYSAIRGDIPSQKAGREPGFSTLKIGKDPDCTSICSKIAGLTFKQMNEKLKDKIHIVGGSTPTEIGNNLVKAMGGNANSSSSSSDSATSIKEALRDVLSGWDGDVECFIRNDTVYIQKISDPSTAKLSLIESKDIFYDSVTVTDVNPSTVNHLEVEYRNQIITIEDESLIKRFGKVSSRIPATGITTLKGAQSFAKTEWAKIRRDNGHKLECKVLGNTKWKIGLWIRVYLPSFNIDDYMYLSKVSQDDSDGDWVCNLTLVDYPPSLGEPKEEENDEENSKGASQ